MDDSESTLAQAPPDAAPGTPQGAKREGMKARAIRGSIWTGVGYMGDSTVRLVGNMVLSRLLFPEAFGLMQLVTVFVLGLKLFSDIGIGPSIIQNRRGEDPAFLNTAWTLQAIRGTILWLVCWVAAVPFAHFYEEELLVWMIPVGGLVALLDGLQSTRVFTCNRKLIVHRLVILKVSTHAIGVLFTVIWAYFHASVWALVAGQIFGAFMGALMSHLALPGERNRFCWDGPSARALIHFGKWILISTIIVFLTGEADKLMLGKLVPKDILGVYGMALVLAAVPVKTASRVSAMVLFPVLSEKARLERDTLPEKLHTARSVVLPVCLLVGVGIVGISPPFFAWLYDKRYADGSWMSQLIAIPVWFTLLRASIGNALLAIGDSRSTMIADACELVGMVIGCLTGHHFFGIPGFILGLLVGRIAMVLVVNVSLYQHGIPVYAQDLTFTLLFAVLAAAVAVGPHLVARLLQLDSTPMGLKVAVAAAVLVPQALWTAVRVRRWTRKP